jgi:hypothetical protein
MDYPCPWSARAVGPGSCPPGGHALGSMPRAQAEHDAGQFVGNCRRVVSAMNESFSAAFRAVRSGFDKFVNRR